MALSQLVGGSLTRIFQGGPAELGNIPEPVDQQFSQGEIAELQLHMVLIPIGLETVVRETLQVALGSDLIGVDTPTSRIIRIQWVRNPGPLIIGIILVAVATLVIFLTSFVLYKVGVFPELPDIADELGNFAVVLVAVFAVVSVLSDKLTSRRKGR